MAVWQTQTNFDHLCSSCLLCLINLLFSFSRDKEVFVQPLTCRVTQTGLKLVFNRPGASLQLSTPAGSLCDHSQCFCNVAGVCSESLFSVFERKEANHLSLADNTVNQSLQVLQVKWIEM